VDLSLDQNNSQDSLILISRLYDLLNLPLLLDGLSRTESLGENCRGQCHAYQSTSRSDVLDKCALSKQISNHFMGGFIVLDQFELMPNVVQTPLRTGKMPGKYSIVASLLLAQISITMERIRNSDELLSRQFVSSDHKRTLDDFIADDAANSGLSHVNVDVQGFNNG
jgi:hypothetical protein